MPEDIPVKRFFAKKKPDIRNSRSNDEYLAWQKEHGLKLYAPVPFKKYRLDPKAPHFKSIADMVEYTTSVPGWAVYHNGTDHVNLENDWCWGYDMAGAVDIYTRSWSDGFAAVKTGMEDAARAALLQAMPTKGLGLHIAGSLVDVGAFLREEPECMWEFEDKIEPQLAIEVEVDNFTSCGTDAKEIMYRGVAVMSAVMALRRLGVFVDLYMREVSNGSVYPKPNNSVALEMRVDMMNQNLTENLSEVLMTLAHPAFNRKIRFQAMCMAWGSMDRGISRNRRNSSEFYPKPGSGKIVIPGHIHNIGHGDVEGIDWENSWASPKAASMLVQLMLQCAASPFQKGR